MSRFCVLFIASFSSFFVSVSYGKTDVYTKEY